MKDPTCGTTEITGALDEVERQLRSLPAAEVIGAEDLEWAIGRVFVKGIVQGTDPVIVELDASVGWQRRPRGKLTVTLNAG